MKLLLLACFCFTALIATPVSASTESCVSGLAGEVCVGTEVQNSGQGDSVIGNSGQGPSPVSQSRAVTIDNPLTVTTIKGLLSEILKIVRIIAIPIIVFFIIYSGFLYVTARGNPEQIKTATNSIVYALIGAVLILGASVLIEIIEGTVTAFKG